MRIRSRDSLTSYHGNCWEVDLKFEGPESKREAKRAQRSALRKLGKKLVKQGVSDYLNGNY